MSCLILAAPSELLSAFCAESDAIDSPRCAGMDRLVLDARKTRTRATDVLRSIVDCFRDFSSVCFIRGRNAGHRVSVKHHRRIWIVAILVKAAASPATHTQAVVKSRLEVRRRFCFCERYTDGYIWVRANLQGPSILGLKCGDPCSASLSRFRLG